MAAGVGERGHVFKVGLRHVVAVAPVHHYQVTLVIAKLREYGDRLEEK